VTFGQFLETLTFHDLITPLEKTKARPQQAGFLFAGAIMR